MRLLVPVVAGILGIAAGITAALVVPRPDGSPGESSEEPSERPSEDPPAPKRVRDPLHLGIPLVNLECTGESVLVVGQGDSAAPLTTAVVNNSDLDLRYLRTEHSCDTLWIAASDKRPRFVVYSGPYDGMQEPCELRMDPAHKGDAVTNLRPGREMLVKCLCVLPVAGFPDLRPGMAVDPGSGIWVRSLQGMLVEYDEQRRADGDPPPYFLKSNVTGVYDEATQARIAAYQPDRDIEERELGSVLHDTWRALTDDTCKLYDF